jgi:hypothetical protein
LKIASQIPE